jgi:hypothetical protein
MAIITSGKGKRQKFLILVLIILAVIVGIYIYSTKKPAATVPAKGPEATVEGEGTPEAATAAVPGTPTLTSEKPTITISKEALSSARISGILASLKKLELVMHGNLPIDVKPEEIGRTTPDNPFVPIP